MFNLFKRETKITESQYRTLIAERKASEASEKRVYEMLKAANLATKTHHEEMIQLEELEAEFKRLGC